MQDEATVEVVRLFVAFTGVAVLAALIARRVGLPLTVVLVLTGLGAGIVAGAAAPRVTSQIVLAVLLPGLVFEAAIRTRLEDLRPALLGVALLAVPGVVLGAVLVAAVLALATGLDPALGFVVGAMVSATDPAAVIATFKGLSAPRPLATLVEAESLFNDGTGIVLFAVAVAAVQTGAPLSGVFVTFPVIIAASSALGAGIGYLGSRLIATVDDHLVELTTTLVVAYGSYLAAEAVDQSGIIASVVAGLTLGSFGRTHGLSVRARDTVETVWEFIGFVLTALVFLLVGLSISLGQLADAAVTITWAVAAVLLARAVIVYLLVGGAARIAHPRGLSHGLPLAWLHVMFWSGLRGAVSVALALSLPDEFPQRDILVGTTYGVVLFTLLVQGTTSGPVMTRLGLRRDPGATALEA